MKKPAIVVAIAAIGLSLSGFTCGPDASREDAKDVKHQCDEANQGDHCVDKTAPRVIAFNNHYPNIETKCDGFGHRIFASTDEHGNGITIYPDPTCPGYVKGQEPTVIISAR